MKKIFHIRRQEAPDTPEYWEDYTIEFDNEEMTVALALMGLKEEDRTVDSGYPYRPLVWEHSCLQKKCGACAMVINGEPCLACDTKLVDIKSETISLEPLKKFPVRQDLLVDRDSMMNTLKALEVWLEDGTTDGEESSYEAFKCLQCGLCLEICPNFYTEGDFKGAAAMAPQASILAREAKEHRKSSSQKYRKSFFDGCGKSLACHDICPAGIDIERLIIRSNAAAIWKRWKGIRK